ncbi:MAG: hypothetical protein ACP5UV_02810, partial [Thermoplasmata archaeon]
ASRDLNKIIDGRIRYIDVPTYEINEKKNDFEKLCSSKDCIGILLTSSMEARIVSEALRSCGRKVFAIGHPTAETLRNEGINPILEGNSDFAATIKKIENVICQA